MLPAAVLALATAGIAAAANGGFTPQFAHSPNTHHTNTAYYVILGFTGAIFVIVESTLALFIWKYRSRGRARTVEGFQLHGATRLEIVWTVIPVVILAVIATVIFIELPNITGAPASAANPLEITVEGHQFYWQFDYPNGTRTINDLYVPVGQVVELKVVSADVVHSWWIPQLNGKIQSAEEKVHGTALPDEPRPELFHHAVRLNQNPPESVGVFPIVRPVLLIFIERNRILNLVRRHIDGHRQFHLG